MLSDHTGDGPSGRPHGAAPILFVTGAPRSGTTLVSRILRFYYNYGMGPEGHWIIPFARRFTRFGDLADDGNAHRLIDAILGEEMFSIVHERYAPVNGHPVVLTHDMVWAELSERSYAGVVHAVLAGLARALDRSHVGNKNPGFLPHLDTLFSLFPDARFLFVVRDGRDAALSTMKQHWGQNSWYANARFWADACGTFERFRVKVPEDQVLVLRYEDVLQEPDETTRRLEAFLRHSLTFPERAGLVAELVGGSRSDNYGKWKETMTPRQHRLYESAAGEWLDKLGYERRTESPVAYPWERAYYMGLEYARRAWGRTRTTLGFPLEGRR